MRAYLLSRLLGAIPVIWGVLTLVFLFVHLIPGDPVQMMLGENASPVDIQSLRNELGLDLPLSVQYVHFLKGVVTGDLGNSIHYRKSVLRLIIQRLPATAKLAFAATFIALLIALPLGIIAALHAGTVIDRTSMLFALFGISMPNFWLGPLLILCFSIKLDIFPVTGYGTLSHLALPAITLGTSLAALSTRMIRSSLLEVIQADYITTARAKGLPEWIVIGKHALRNALIPVVTVVGLQIGGLLGGSIITEKIFSWPGIGRLLIDSIGKRDYPVVQGCVLCVALCYIIINLLVDILYAFLDPRIRLGKTGRK